MCVCANNAAGNQQSTIVISRLANVKDAGDNHYLAMIMCLENRVMVMAKAWQRRRRVGRIYRLAISSVENLEQQDIRCGGKLQRQLQIQWF